MNVTERSNNCGCVVMFEEGQGGCGLSWGSAGWRKVKSRSSTLQHSAYMLGSITRPGNSYS